MNYTLLRIIKLELSVSVPVSLRRLLLWLLHSLGYTHIAPLAVECVYQDIPPTALSMVF